MPDRTTIVLPAELKQRATTEARHEGVSFGEFVRQALEQRLTRTPKKITKVRRKKKTGDTFLDNLVVYHDDGPTDMAARHDDYLYEALTHK